MAAKAIKTLREAVIGEMNVKVENKGITAPKGFMAAATAAGIKYQGRDDMAMIFSESPCSVAGCFTSNLVKAAPVIWDRDAVASAAKSGRGVHAVVVNSGIANACTGEEGMEICRVSARAACEELKKAGRISDISEEQVLLGSTGVIGMQIPAEKINAGIADLAAALSSDEEAGHRSEKAIMTTDTLPKEISLSFELGGAVVNMSGMSKGSGMIHPNMCTMLSYVTTDAAIEAGLLQKALDTVVPDTFNMISVDGDTSTNDTILVLANGEAGNPVINDGAGKDYGAFLQALSTVCEFLAKSMAADGEGATKLVECAVQGADSKENARALAKSVVCSSLTKAAMYGCDANWGRILCAMGYSGVKFEPEKVKLSFRDELTGKTILIYENGKGAQYSEEEATELLKSTHVKVLADMDMGNEQATAYGCDLTHEYVDINADYRS